MNRIDDLSYAMSTFMRSVIRLSLLVSVTLSLTACGFFGGDERPAYQGAEYYKNLEVPPDLTRPDDRDAVTVPNPTAEALQRFRDNNKLETVVTPKFDGVRVVSYAGSSWIEIDNTPEQVWGELLKFWEREGINLVQVRPLLGFMETEWVDRLDNDPGFLRAMFQRFEPDQKDKFRARVEGFDGGNRTRLYIAHMRIERSTYGEDADEFYWESLPSDVEAERELISRMALYAGLTETQSIALLENYRPYASLVKTDRTNPTALTMTGSMDFVWRRAMRALDRMRMQNIREMKEENVIKFAVGKVTGDDLEIEEDDVSSSSWLMQLFTGESDDSAALKEDRQYRLEFTDLNGRIQIDVVDERHTRTTDDEGDVVGTALAEQIRNLLVKQLD